MIDSANYKWAVARTKNGRELHGFRAVGIGMTSLCGDAQWRPRPMPDDEIGVCFFCRTMAAIEMAETLGLLGFHQTADALTKIVTEIISNAAATRWEAKISESDADE